MTSVVSEPFAAADAPTPGPFRGGVAIRVRGLVQGVGFRPNVWRLAHKCGIAGEVRNDAQGVLIHAWGEKSARARFLQCLSAEAPPLARIDALECLPLVGKTTATDFTIAASAGGEVHTGVVADAATCAACLAEIGDPDNRRHGYAFTNCTHCGPRLSIVTRIPYDRTHTSMAAFPLCAACREEYQNPADRRFHAQPNACSDCGPRVGLEVCGDWGLGTGDDADRDSGLGTRDSGLGKWALPASRITIFPRITHHESPSSPASRLTPHASRNRDSGLGTEDSGDVIAATQGLLRAGRIVAIKGIGGFHLACDAGNEEAVARLRRRKRREHKPFALMARDVAMIRRYCGPDATELELLQSVAAPIVLLDADGTETLAQGVAPRQRGYGFMLPYTPLHHLLMAGLDTPIVLTSGNRSGEPQCIGNEEARTALADIADAFVLHDRDIVNRLDDSVVRVIAGAPALLRRARGYAPAPMQLPAGFAAAPPVLAFGGELKNSFCLLADGAATLSQHIGDLENAAANRAYRATLDLYLELFQHQPRLLAIDGHPDYLPSKLGREWAASRDLPLTVTQHHHAHIAACLADNGLDPDTAPVLGIALDGTGYGDDGTIWGGEFLLADYHGYRRLASLSPVPMPGGAQAVRQPWRMAYAHLQRTGELQQLLSANPDAGFCRQLRDKPLAILDRMLATGCNSPLTSSCGRLFDAVAAVIGICQVAGYEGQAAIELEAAAGLGSLRQDRGYPFAITQDDGLPRLDPAPMWSALLADLGAAVERGIMAARFHAGLARAVAAMVAHLAHRHGDPWGSRLALSGGVFQNALLSELLITRLEARGWTVFRHQRIPANDGGLSLGQAAIAAARALSSPSPLWGEGRGEGLRRRVLSQGTDQPCA